MAAISALLAIMACFIYNKVYSGSFYVDFSKIITTTSIIMSCVVACSLMTLGYALVNKWKSGKFIGWVNILYTLITFATIVGIMSFKLPLDIEFPEMFPGLAIPMHFFPLLSFLAIMPFFNLHHHHN